MSTKKMINVNIIKNRKVVSHTYSLEKKKKNQMLYKTKAEMYVSK